MNTKYHTNFDKLVSRLPDGLDYCIIDAYTGEILAMSGEQSEFFFEWSSAIFTYTYDGKSNGHHLFSFLGFGIK